MYIFFIKNLVTEPKNDSDQATWEATMNEGLEATKIAGNALSALTPITNDGDDNGDSDVANHGEQLASPKQISPRVNDDDDDKALLL